MVNWLRKWRYPDYPFRIVEETNGYGEVAYSVQNHKHDELGMYWNSEHCVSTRGRACELLKQMKDEYAHKQKRRIVKTRLITCHKSQS